MLTAINPTLRKVTYFLLVLIVSFTSNVSYTQGTGYIIRKATGTGPDILDPNKVYNAPNYTSKTLAGFQGDDVVNSELPFKPIRAFSIEPFGDLRRGPGHLFSDFVPDSEGNGYYAYFDGSNLIFRFRMGSVIPGAKGYSVLIDTDGRFGATGPNADPDYQPATTGTNGNPGFEIEIVLETGSRLAVYDVDGKNDAVPKVTYQQWTDYSQLSIAGTNDNGDPDFFLDFYVPWSDLVAAFPSLTTSTSLRMIATTVMAPKAAIGGPKSDIYGVNDNNYPISNDQYEALISSQSPITLTQLGGNSTTAIGTLCTTAPFINAVTVNTSINPAPPNGSVQGTWTKNLAGASSTATIEVYKGGVYLGETTATSGGTWTLSGVVINSGETITAKATVTGESNVCYASNYVIASATPACISKPSALSNVCMTNMGASGEGWTPGDYINIWRVTATGNLPIASGIPGAANSTFTTVTGVTGGWAYSGGCSSNGNSKLDPGTYIIYASSATGCISSYSIICNQSKNGNKSYGSSPAITINNASEINETTSSITGAYSPGAGTNRVSVYIDNVYKGDATLNGSVWTYSLSNSLLKVGQIILVTGQQQDAGNTNYCQSNATARVNCFSSAPVITADINSNVGVGLPISGISNAPAGSEIKVYNTTNTSSIASAIVQNDGSWATGTITLVSGQKYYATATSGGCMESGRSIEVTAIAATSSSRCGNITTTDITSNTIEISGTLSGASANKTIVNLYIDGYNIGSFITNNNNWGPINVSGKIYANGVLTIGIQQESSTEVICTNKVTVSCTKPTQPIVTPEISQIGPGGKQTYRIMNPVSGVFYGIADETTGQSLATGVWATSSTGSLSITTNPVSSTVSVIIKATSVTSTEMCSVNSTARTLVVDAVLPVHLIEFKGKRENTAVTLNWTSEAEIDFSHYEIERSPNGVTYSKIGEKRAQNASGRTSYSFIDKQPLQGIAYYRLRLVDTDGKFRYSNVIALNSNGSIITLNAIRPNPFYSGISIGLTLEKNQEFIVRLVDAGGRNVQVQTFNGIKGSNEINFNSLANLPAGIYLLVIATGEGEIKQKLVKGK